MKIDFPRTKLRLAIQTAQKAGLEVGSFEVAPDGTIRISTKEPAMTVSGSPLPASLFDQLKAEGKL